MRGGSPFLICTKMQVVEQLSSWGREETEQQQSKTSVTEEAEGLRGQSG